MPPQSQLRVYWRPWNVGAPPKHYGIPLCQFLNTPLFSGNLSSDFFIVGSNKWLAITVSAHYFPIHGVLSINTLYLCFYALRM